MLDAIHPSSFLSDLLLAPRRPSSTSSAEAVELTSAGAGVDTSSRATAKSGKRAGAGAGAGDGARAGVRAGAGVGTNVWSTSDDEGEDRLIQDFGSRETRRRVAPGLGESRCVESSSPTERLDRYITDEQGLRYRIVYEPTEMAKLLQPRRSDPGACRQLMAHILEAALDPSRTRCETLLLCKAVTDAYLVNRSVGTAEADGREAGEDLIAQSLRHLWCYALAVGPWDGYVDGQPTAVDFHTTASWFQAWEASDSCESTEAAGGAQSEAAEVATSFFPEVLPGNWAWVLDNLYEGDGHEYTVDGLHLEQELELEATKERQLGLPRDEWALDELKRSLLLVSDDRWFEGVGGLIELKILGPGRPSTFNKVFSDVPGAIYGCLKDSAGVALTPPTFRMYTTGDIFEALGPEAVMRSRYHVGGETAGEVKFGEIELETDWTGFVDSDDSETTTLTRRQVVSLIEIQCTWVGGYTNVLAWLDSVDA